LDAVDTSDAIRSRRDVRSFANRPIAPDDLERILEAGRRAPSSRNWQPWDFVVVTRREDLQELAKVWQGAGHVATSAATIALISPIQDDENKARTEHFDLGQATMSMMIAAADLGIGSGHAAVRDQELARPLGYPADRPLRPLRNPDRRPFDDLVHVGRF
jgi:nitroreductase